MIRLLTIAVLAAGCATVDLAAQHDETYRSDTLLVNRLMGPMGIETPHGQITIAVGSKITEKMLLASLHPNVLTMQVVSPGRVFKQEARKLAITFDNGVWLEAGRLDMAFTMDKLDLRGDLIGINGNLDGHGFVGASVKFYGVRLLREVELWTKFNDPLQFHLEKGDVGWLLRLVGAPLKLHVTLKLPALRVAGYDLLPMSFTRDIELPVASVQPFMLPLPTPQSVKVGPAEMSLGLQNMSIGTHDGILWVGADLSVGMPVKTEPAPVPAAPAPASPPRTPQQQAPAPPTVQPTPDGRQHLIQ
jgi:hypothetical protein